MIYLITKDPLEKVRDYFEHCHEFQKKYPLEIKTVIHGEKFYFYRPEFYKEYGYDFDAIDPLRFLYVPGRKETLSSLESDLLFLSFCYNDPLNVFVGTDAAMFHFLPDGYNTMNSTRWSRLNQLEETDNRNKMLPKSKQYLRGDRNQLMHQIKEELAKINMREAPVWKFQLDTNGFHFAEQKNSMEERGI